ncbi:MAG TPA: DUF6069 family protein [Streptosporangiaceae bacterium]|nr:DUF6069 family protein [Streptosporangiaceae bacterium]
MTTTPMPNDPRPDRSGSPGYDRPAYAQPGYGQPDYGQAGQGRPGYDQPGYGHAGYEHPGYEHPGYSPRPGRPPPSRPSVAAGQLWGGGVATAVVAALVALVGVLVTRWLVGIPLLAPMRDGAYGDVHTTSLVLLAAAAALIATGLLHLLLLSTPRPTLFFGWIIGLATVLAVVLPFTTSAPLDQKAATAIVFLILGIAIGTLLSGVGARSVRVRGTGPGYGPPAGYGDRNPPSQFS